MRARRQVIDGKQECIGCKQWLPFDRFNKHSPSSTGYAWRCKECHKTTPLGGLTPSQRAMQWAKNNPERFEQLSKESRDRVIHDERRLEARREHSRDWYSRNKPAALAARKAWQQNNPWVGIADRARTLVRCTVHGTLNGGKKFQFLVGCTGQQFRTHLQSLWLKGMDWSNFGKGGWTIGHIKSCASFKSVLLTKEGQQACFHFSNLQPEWERCNNVKHTKESLTTAQLNLEQKRLIPKAQGEAENTSLYAESSHTPDPQTYRTPSRFG